MTREQVRQQTDDLFAAGKYDEIKAFLLSEKDITQRYNELATVFYLCGIYEKEKEAGQATVFSKVSNIDELLERYTRLKFYLRRIDFDAMEDGNNEFWQFLLKNQVSSYELATVLDFCVIHRDKVLKALKGEA